MEKKTKTYFVASELDSEPIKDNKGFIDINEAIAEAKAVSLTEGGMDEHVIVYECVVKPVRLISYQQPKVEVIK